MPHPPPPDRPYQRLSDADRARSLDATLAEAPAGGAAWVFAYGSLMWDPCFTAAERRPAHLAGFRRAFTMWTGMARGTPEVPGLGMALEPGGGPTAGIAYRLDDDRRDADLDALWRREMATGVYRPAWVDVGTGPGAVNAIAFVAEPRHPQYIGALAEDEIAAHIARASGTRGRCRDYLAAVVAGLDDLGTPDADLARLLARVDGLGVHGS